MKKMVKYFQMKVKQNKIVNILLNKNFINQIKNFSIIQIRINLVKIINKRVKYRYCRKINRL